MALALCQSNDAKLAPRATMKTIIICINHRANPNNPSCGARGSEKIAASLQQQITEKKLPVTLKRFKCLGHCDQGPNLRIAPDGRFFYGVTEDGIEQILKEVVA